MDTFSELLISVRRCIELRASRAVVVIGEYQEPRAQVMLDSILNITDSGELEKAEQMLNYLENKQLPGRNPDIQYYRESLKIVRESFAQSGATPLNISLVAAEKVLEETHPAFAETVAKARKHPYHIRAVQQDLGGTAQWNAGTYGTPND